MARETAINQLKILKEHYRKEGEYLSIANFIALDIAINILENLDGDDPLSELYHKYRKED